VKISKIFKKLTWFLILTKTLPINLRTFCHYLVILNVWLKWKILLDPQESGTYSEGLVPTEYKNTHFVKIEGKFVSDESFSRGTSRIHWKLFTSVSQVIPLFFKFLGSRSTFTATVQVLTATIRVKYFHIPSKKFYLDHGS
jgi:hypothetical protein